MRTGPIVALATVTVALTIGMSGVCAAAPVKEVLSTHYGWEVDKTTRGNLCTVASGDECQPGRKSGEPGGFENLADVAIGSESNGEQPIYVADYPNQRIQEIAPTGKFALMLGKEVNETKDVPGATAEEKDICTQAEMETEHVKCKAGSEGSGEGEFKEPTSIAVDRATHDLYVLDELNHRIQEFTEAGKFVLMFGKEVNETKDGTLGATAEEKDICTQAEIESVHVKCKAGVAGPEGGGAEPGVFSFNESLGAQLAVGGPEQLLYVGDDDRVQEFEHEGKFKRAIALPAKSQMVSLALEESGDLYLVYKENSVVPTATIHKLGASGEQVAEFALSPRHSSAELFSVQGVAVDGAGRLAVSEEETLRSGAGPRSEEYFGSLLDGGTGALITEITVPNNNDGGMEFNAKDELYLAVSESFETVRYAPVEVAEVVGGAASCTPAAEGSEADATFACTLNGEVNPEGVPDTEAWFEWGLSTALGEATPRQILCTTVCGSTPVHVEAEVEGIPPNESVSYRVAAFDKVVKAPEAPLRSYPSGSVATKLVAPRLLGPPSAEFVKRSSAVLFAVLNPENAATRYWFQYAPVALCEHLQGCAQALSTPVEESAAYARTGATAEVTGLQPGAAYRYRLVAESENTAKTEHADVGGEGEQEATFTTVSPIAVGARTGAASQVGATSAVISGGVEGDGQPVSYAFELGVDQGASTQYGVVYSGAIGVSTVPVEEALALSGLQPGTTYAYRIAVRYGTGSEAGWSSTGAPASFTTAGLPSVLVAPGVLAQLPPPNTAFPKAPAKATHRKLTRAQQLANALKACAKKPKSKRAACRRSAEKKYATKPKKKK
jgi:hypothetical protein